MSENTIDTKPVTSDCSCSDDRMNERSESHLKDVLRLVNAINTAVAEGKIVTVEPLDFAISTQITGAIPFVYDIACIKGIAFMHKGIEIPAYWPSSGDMILARYSHDANIEVLCESYVAYGDRKALKNHKNKSIMRMNPVMNIDHCVDYASPRQEAHRKDVLELVNAINTAVAEGKIVTVERPSFPMTTQIAGAFPCREDVICIESYSLNPHGSSLPAGCLFSGDVILARYSGSDKTEILCERYIKGDDRHILAYFK